jgi:hypothetical protein
MRRPVQGLFAPLPAALLTLTAGCSNHADTVHNQPSHTDAANLIVGRWEALRTCTDMVRALNRQHLGVLAPGVVGDYFPHATYEELAAKHDVCSGAKPQRHSHFFTADGSFGSLDQHGNQVDDGKYTVVDSHTIRIGEDAVFDYRIRGGTLRLTPRITDEQRQDALNNPRASPAVTYMVAVAVQGIEWKRVPCHAWC